MPITKQPKLKEPLWKEWDCKAQKKGQHHTVYSVNGDEYVGDWENNKKNGKGTKVWKSTGCIYDGDWKSNKRSGFGTLSSIQEDGSHTKVYSGGWKNDKKHGYGTYFYLPNEYYEGEWLNDERSGWGRMYFADGSVFEGEWSCNMRNGSGMLRLANENRYEGNWHDDKKHGDGKFYHLDKGQVFIGTWLEGVAKCGEMKDFGREGAPNATQYPIPQLKLEDSASVLEGARAALDIDSP